MNIKDSSIVIGICAIALILALAWQASYAAPLCDRLAGRMTQETAEGLPAGYTQRAGELLGLDPEVKRRLESKR